MIMIGFIRKDLLPEQVCESNSLQWFSSLNDSDQYHNDGDDQQDMNEITHRIANDPPFLEQNSSIRFNPYWGTLKTSSDTFGDIPQEAI